jgi:ABC-type transport system substrate-binding protein
MKQALVFMVFLMVAIFVLSACGAKTSTTTVPSKTTQPVSVPGTSAPVTTSAITAAPTSAPASVPTLAPTSVAPVTTTASAANQPLRGGTLKILVMSDIGTLGSPNESVGGNYMRVAAPAMDWLLRFDEKYNLQPRLLESWEIAPDGKSITLRAQKGIKFHDGTDFNAEAVKYNIANAAPNGVVPSS